MIFASNTKLSNYFNKLAYYDNFFSVIKNVFSIFAKIRFGMTELNNLIQYCIRQYKQPKRCRACVNEKQCGNADNCYRVCIYKIHRFSNKVLRYNCPNMLNCYVLKHFYRYASEIESVFERFFSGFSGHIHIASIGCGPASELFGIVNFKERTPLSTFTFDYKGFDLDSIWQPIWTYAESRFDYAHFLKQDFFEYYKTNSKPDVIILNYMLSDMAKYSPESMPQFLEKFLDFIDSMPYGMVIINDITYESTKLDTAYGCLFYIHKRISKGNTYKIYPGSFKKLPVHTDKYFGKRIDNDAIRSDMLNVPYNIEPFSSCGSLQYIILKPRQSQP